LAATIRPEGGSGAEQTFRYRAYVSAAPIRCGVEVLVMAQTGQSEAIHSPEE